MAAGGVETGADIIRVVIADDEPLARKRIRRLLSADRDLEVVAECSNGAEVIACLRSNPVDLLFLDIQMPELDGFEVMERPEAQRVPVVVFVTAYDAYALRAFEVHAFDYLLKPFDRQRFQKTVQRARIQLQQIRKGAVDERLASLLAGLQTRRTPEPDRLAVRNGGRVLFVKTNEIDWIEAADNYVCLHAGTEKHLLRETMSAIEGKLDPARFLRIHRSTIVNVDRIKELQPWFRGDYVVILQSGEKLTLSRSYRDRLKHLLEP